MFQFFMPATSTAIDNETNTLVYVPGIFSVMEKTIIWCAVVGYPTLTEAIQVAKDFVEALETDTINFYKTGKKNDELYSIMCEGGVFLDPSNSESAILDTSHVPMN